MNVSGLGARSALAEVLGELPGLDGGSVPDGPFLSVVLRTQGHRAEMLRDALVCLSGQQCADFEVLIMIHDPDRADASAAVRALVDEEVPDLAERVTVRVSTGGSRSHPLNDAVSAGRGRYFAFFDDDDLLLANWVEEFYQLAKLAPGRVLRSLIVDQRCANEVWSGERGLIASGPIEYRYPRQFSLVEHTRGGATPFHGFAFPREAFTVLGLRFDESLSIYEDWELELRAIGLLGVANSETVTGIYRRHHSVDNSLMLFGDEERHRLLEQLVRDRAHGHWFLIDGSEFEVFRERAARVDEMWHEKQLMYEKHEMLIAETRSLRWLIEKFREVFRERYGKPKTKE